VSRARDYRERLKAEIDRKIRMLYPLAKSTFDVFTPEGKRAAAIVAPWAVEE
jgi:hypothetical protein